MEILMSQCTNETTQCWQLLFESYLKYLCIRSVDYNVNNQLAGLRQKLCFTARKWNNWNNYFFDWQQECFDIKGNLYNHFFIITSTDSWTFRTFHPSLHKPVAPLCCSSFHKKASKDEKIILTEAEKHISDDKKLCTIFNNFFSKVVSDSKNTHTFSINYHWNVWKTPQYSFQKDYSSEGIESYLRLKHKKQLLDEWYSHQSY